MHASHRISFCLALATMTISLTASPHSLYGSPPSVDPHKVVSYEKCSKCHQNEINVWKKTPHFATFTTLHRNPKAKEIAKNLGLRSVKRNDVCIQCHYTQQHSSRGIRPISGISCESCHGAAADWLEIHNDYGGPNATREQETAEHKRKRREASIARGMRNPVNLYLVAQSCLGCHTAPNERLVNVGGHPAGSLDFELVSWSQGMVRHNFVRTNGERNDVSSPDRLRVMFVVGVMADLEYSLRATAIATEVGPYAKTVAQRVDRIRKRLRSMQKVLDQPLLQQVIDAAYQAKLKLNNKEQLEAAADAVSEAAYAFAAGVDGSELTAIDSMLPSKSQLK